MVKASSRLRLFEAAVALSGGGAFVLVLLFRDALAGSPGLMVAGTLALFLTPGVLLARWFLNDYFPGPTRPTCILNSTQKIKRGIFTRLLNSLKHQITNDRC